MSEPAASVISHTTPSVVSEAVSSSTAPQTAGPSEPQPPLDDPDAFPKDQFPKDTDTEEFYAKLDNIRQQQLALAAEHLKLTSIEPEGLNLKDMMAEDEETAAKYQRNNEQFAKKEAEVAGLMDKLEALAQSMDELFQKPLGATDPNPPPKAPP